MMSIAPSLTNIQQHHTHPENDSSLDPITDVPKKKKKKRRREGQDADDGGGELSEKKKKKRKKRHSEEDAVETSSAVDPALLCPNPPIDDVPAKKKSKKKDKSKQLATQSPPEPDQQQLDASNSQATAAALISAIVAAAAGTPDTPVPQDPNMLQYQPQMLLHPSQQQPFMPYPFQHGYGLPPYMQPPTAQPQNMFSTPPGLPFSELAFGSNEDVLRALQALDMSKITNVLKTLGEAAAAANDGSQGYTGEQVQSTPLGQVPVTSGAILGFASQEPNTSTGHRRTLDMTLPGTEHHTRADHAYLLANKWLNAGKLSELVRTEGLVYKKGKFSAIEEQQLKAAIEHYRMMKQLSHEDMTDLIFPKVEKTKDNAFWSEITTAVPQRPIIAVYHHVRRSYHPMKQQGKFDSTMNTALARAVADLGQQWEKVSQRVGRMSSDCRDRYRNHIINRDVRVNGQWTQQEEEELTRIVTDMTIKQGKDIDNDVFWGRVSELMGGKRGRQQCRIKWTDALSKTIKNEGRKPRWSQQDAFILVHKVDSLNVRDDTEIDWKTIPDPHWNLWSAHTLQRRWLTMKRGIKGYEDMTHQEIMDILRVKKAQLPTPPIVSSKKRKERKVTSAAAIAECDGAVLEAGSSTGPGTMAASTATVEDSDEDGSTDSG